MLETISWILQTSKYENSITFLLNALKAKDIYTYEHSLRVAEISLVLCKILRINKKQTREIAISAALHDIGKIKIPNSILCGRNKLSPKEWNIIRRHPQYGVDYIKDIIHNDFILKNILFHHERIDGSGYPFGLKEYQIPIGAQIISLADSLDAMITKRSYKEGFPLKKVKQILIHDKGVLFSPFLIDTILENWYLIEYEYHC